MSEQPIPDQDAIVVGGGPAGLSAAVWLGRYRRNTRLVDAGEYRNRWVERMHGVLANDPTAPQTLLQRARQDVRGKVKAPRWPCADRRAGGTGRSHGQGSPALRAGRGDARASTAAVGAPATTTAARWPGCDSSRQPRLPGSPSPRLGRSSPHEDAGPPCCHVTDLLDARAVPGAQPVTCTCSSPGLSRRTSMLSRSTSTRPGTSATFSARRRSRRAKPSRHRRRFRLELTQLRERSRNATARTRSVLGTTGDGLRERQTVRLAMGARQ